MKKHLISLLLILSVLACYAFPVQATQQISDLLENFAWIEGEKGTFSGHYGAVSYTGASDGKTAEIYKNGAGTGNTATYSFNLNKEGNYDIWILSSLGNVNYASQFDYSVDGESPKKATEGFTGEHAYWNDTRGVPIGWIKLESSKLMKESTHSLVFTCDTARTLNNDNWMVHILDSVLVVPTAWNWTPNGLVKPIDAPNIKLTYNNVTFDKQVYGRAETVQTSVTATLSESIESNVYIWAALERNGEIVATGSVDVTDKTIDTAVTTPIEIKIPSFAPDGEYKVVGGIGMPYQHGFYGDTGVRELGTLKIGNSEAVLNKAIISTASVSVNWDKLNVNYTVSNSNVSEATAYVKLWQGDVLWGVAEGEAPSDITVGAHTAEIKIPDGLPEGTYQAELGFYNVNNTFDVGNVITEINGKYAYKPLSNGVYASEKTGREHFWYVNQTGTLIWDGEPYIPIGGMDCPEIIVGYSKSSLENNEAAWARDKARIDRYKQEGVRDIYINAVNGMHAPRWVWEYLLQYLEENDIYYALQTNGGVKNPSDIYYIRANGGKITASIGLQITTGYVTVTTDAALSEIKTEGTMKPKGALYALINYSGDVCASGRAELVETDTGYRFSATVPVTTLGMYTVSFTPLVEQKGNRMVNFWDYGEESVAAAKEYSKIPMGDNARAIIDPVLNESGYYNNSESMRPYTDKYNALYAAWLEARYANVSKLNNAWVVTPKVESFAEASKLVPIYTDERASDDTYKIYATDKNATKLYTIQGEKTAMWNDFLKFRDESTVDFYNKIADAYKEKMNLPVVIKNVWGHKEYFTNRNQSGGLDGLGAEAYGSSVAVTNRVISNYGMTKQYAKTAWNIVTETGTDENITNKYNSNDWGYSSEEEMHNNFSAMMKYGAKGIYDFCLSAPHHTETDKAYGYIENKDNFTYLRSFRNKVNPQEVKESEPTEPQIYLLPHNSNYYTTPNRYTAVLHSDAYKSKKESKLYNDDKTMVLMSENPWVLANVVAANFQKGPASYYQGQQFAEMLGTMPAEKQAVYLGFRYDLGAVPEIDKYFTGNYVTLSNGKKAQVLNANATDTVQVIQEKDGKPWIIRDGNLWIISAEDAIGDDNTINYISDIGIFMADDAWNDMNVQDGKNVKFKNTGIVFDTDIYTAIYNQNKLERVEKKPIRIHKGINALKLTAADLEQGFTAYSYIWGKDSIIPIRERVVISE